MYHEFWTIIISGISGATAIIIAIIAFRQGRTAETQANSSITQTSILKEEFEIKHRPWIGIKDFHKDKSGKWVVTYTNYGSIPSKNIVVKTLASDATFTRERLEKLAKSLTERTTVVFPDQIKNLQLTGIPDEHVQSAEQGKTDLFIGLIFEYILNNEKLGIYGGIWRYDKPTNQFAVIGQWTDLD